MAENYEYHKRNDYPGERKAERKRVFDRAEIAEKRSDARVAEKGRTEGLKADNRPVQKCRRDDALMDARRERSVARATSIHKSRNNADIIGVVGVSCIMIILVAGLGWSYSTIQQQDNDMNILNAQFSAQESQLSAQIANSDRMAVQLSNADNQACQSVDTVLPTVLDVSLTPMSNAVDVPLNAQITVVFSEDMDPSTINADVLTVMQRTTPESGEYRSIAIDKTVTYRGRTATFTSNELLTPNQQYGNVYTVTVSQEAKDLAGNPLMRDYVWSFTTGGDRFYTGATTTQLNQVLAPLEPHL